MNSASALVLFSAKFNAPALKPSSLSIWKNLKLLPSWLQYFSTGFQTASSTVLLSTTITSYFLYFNNDKCFSVFFNRSAGSLKEGIWIDTNLSRVELENLSGKRGRKEATSSTEPCKSTIIKIAISRANVIHGRYIKLRPSVINKINIIKKSAAIFLGKIFIQEV